MKKMNCLICKKELYSGIGDGCRLCGMPLEEEDDFCCHNCEIKFKKIKNE